MMLFVLLSSLFFHTDGKEIYIRALQLFSLIILPGFLSFKIFRYYKKQIVEMNC
jgi:hypothetical protein